VTTTVRQRRAPRAAAPGGPVPLGLAASALALAVACAPSTGGGEGGAPGEDGGPVDPRCAHGPTMCEGSTYLVCQDGAYDPVDECDDACVPGLGCVLCEPGRGTCEPGDMANVCRNDGMAYELHHCDPVQGMSCDAERGACVGACSRSVIGASYIGCEYYPTITGNGLVGEWDFAVIISNTSGQPARVRLEGGSLGAPQERIIAARGVETWRLPYDSSMQMCASVLGAYCTVPSPYGGSWRGGAFRLRSDQPVTVYQFSPLDYQQGQQLSHSNDASLLLPATSLGTDYVVATWPTWVTPNRVAYPGIVAITSTEDDTEVRITPTAHARPFGSPQVERALTMDRGDVVQLASDAFDIPPAGQTTWGEDLTGTRVRSNKPIQVIGAHFCTRIPLNFEACDHLEDAMFPVSALSHRYAVAAPFTASFQRASFITRIVATEPGTDLAFDPPLTGAGAHIASAGEFVEIGPQSQDFVVTANHKIVVAQYMLAETIVGTGDPSMALPSPIEQWRTSYLFHAPTNYEANLVTVVAPAGTTVSLNGQPVTGFSPIGSSGLSSARVRLGTTTGGDHEITGSAPFGIGVYGYGRATSYWYPGGLDLEPIVIQ
jgi:hypothetical protein